MASGDAALFSVADPFDFHAKYALGFVYAGNKLSACLAVHPRICHTLAWYMPGAYQAQPRGICLMPGICMSHFWRLHRIR